jgi:hypothetical protein
MLSEPPADAGSMYSWSNRIHLLDAARLILLLLSLPVLPAHINGVDNEPSRLEDVLHWLAAQRGQAWPESRQDTLPRSNDCGKRISNALAHSLGFAPLYPSFRKGFANQTSGLSTEQ